MPKAHPPNPQTRSAMGASFLHGLPRNQVSKKQGQLHVSGFPETGESRPRIVHGPSKAAGTTAIPSGRR